MRGFVLLSILLIPGAGVLAADTTPVGIDALGGAWTLDAASSASASAQPGAAAPTAADAPAGTSGRHRGGKGGAGIGSAGAGGAHGNGGGRHHGERSTGANPGHVLAQEEEAEQAERGLARVFARNVTITALKQRIRLDDGEHAIELDRDGTNISGAGIGGTVALTATQPDLVVETLTDSGYSLNERYHLADDGRHLELHVNLKRPGVAQPHEFVRVFDRPAVAAVPR